MQTRSALAVTRAVETPVVRDAPDHIQRPAYGRHQATWPQPNVDTMIAIYSRIITDLTALGITDSDAVDDLIEGLTTKRDQLRSNPSIYLSAGDSRAALQREPAYLIGNAMFRLADQGLVPRDDSCAALCPSGTPSSPGWTLLLYPFSLDDQRPDAPIAGAVREMMAVDSWARKAC